MFLKASRNVKRLRSLAFSAIVSISCSGGVLFAQEDELIFDERYENWFTIELIIFDKRYGNTTANETWPNNVELLYEPKVDFLFTPDEWRTFITQPSSEDLESGLDYEPEVKTLSSTAETSAVAAGSALDIYPNPDTRSSLSGPTAEGTLSAFDNKTSQINDSFSSETKRPPLETPFIKLDKDKFELSFASRRLQRRPGHRILFHERWRQPIADNRESLPVLITGGNTFAEHFELEGTIKISLNRYLHLETNLWKTSFVPNYGQELKYWPALPKRPEPIPPWKRDSDIPTDVSDPFHSNSDEIDLDAAFNLNRPTSKNGPFDLALSRTDNPNDEEPIQLNSDFSSKLAQQSPYLVNEIITLKQKRRMRSEETHYIDHPLLGILIRILPYEVSIPSSE